MYKDSCTIDFAAAGRDHLKSQFLVFDESVLISRCVIAPPNKAKFMIMCASLCFVEDITMIISWIFIYSQ